MCVQLVFDSVFSFSPCVLLCLLYVCSSDQRAGAQHKQESDDDVRVGGVVCSRVVVWWCVVLCV